MGTISHLIIPKYFLTTCSKVVENFHTAKSCYCASHCTVSVCLSILCSYKLIEFDYDCKWLVDSVSTGDNQPHKAGPTKYKVRSWRHRCSAWPLTGLHGRRIPILFVVGAIVMDPFFVWSHNVMQKSILFCLWINCSREIRRWLASLGCIS